MLQRKRGELLDGAVVGFLRSRDQLQRRRLAGAVAADEAHAFAGLDGEVGVEQYLLLTERDGDRVESDQRSHGVFDAAAERYFSRRRAR